MCVFQQVDTQRFDAGHSIAECGFDIAGGRMMAAVLNDVEDQYTRRHVPSPHHAVAAHNTSWSVLSIIDGIVKHWVTARHGVQPYLPAADVSPPPVKG
jgi:hypothetical protein